MDLARQCTVQSGGYIEILFLFVGLLNVPATGCFETISYSLVDLERHNETVQSDGYCEI